MICDVIVRHCTNIVAAAILHACIQLGDTIFVRSASI